MVGPYRAAGHESPVVEPVEGYAGEICCCHATGKAVRDPGVGGAEGGAYPD